MPSGLVNKIQLFLKVVLPVYILTKIAISFISLFILAILVAAEGKLIWVLNRISLIMTLSASAYLR